MMFVSFSTVAVRSICDQSKSFRFVLVKLKIINCLTTSVYINISFWMRGQHKKNRYCYSNVTIIVFVFPFRRFDIFSISAHCIVLASFVIQFCMKLFLFCAISFFSLISRPSLNC